MLPSHAHAVRTESLFIWEAAALGDMPYNIPYIIPAASTKATNKCVAIDESDLLCAPQGWFATYREKVVEWGCAMICGTACIVHGIE